MSDETRTPAPDATVEPPDLFTAMLMARADEPDPVPFAFEVGSHVWVRKHVLQDGQTRPYWVESRCTVIARRSTLFMKIHSYQLRHPNGAVDFFVEEELYQRGKRGAE